MKHRVQTLRWIILCLGLLCAGSGFSLMAQIDEEEERSALDDTTTDAAQAAAEKQAGQSPFVTDTVNHVIWLGPVGLSTQEIYEQIATLEFGMNILPSATTTFQNRFTLANVGTIIAFAFPVRFTGVRTYYKAKAIFCDAAVGSRTDSISYFYFYAINELVMGKTLVIKSLPVNVIPQLGFGIAHGLMLANRKGSGMRGTTNENYAFHYNLGVQVLKYFILEKSRFAFGVQIMYERAFKADDVTESRLNFCITVAD